MSKFNVNEVEGKTVIVTGASSGIGRAIAEVLQARGARVIAEDIDPAVNELKREGLVPFVADVTKDGTAEQAVALAIEHFGKLDVLFNNAGIMHAKDDDAVSTDEAVWDLTLDINAKGVFLSCREALRHMLSRERISGSIIINASISALAGIPGQGAQARR